MAINIIRDGQSGLFIAEIPLQYDPRQIKKLQKAAEVLVNARKNGLFDVIFGALVHAHELSITDRNQSTFSSRTLITDANNNATKFCGLYRIDLKSTESIEEAMQQSGHGLKEKELLTDDLFYPTLINLATGSPQNSAGDTVHAVASVIMGITEYSTTGSGWDLEENFTDHPDVTVFQSTSPVGRYYGQEDDYVDSIIDSYPEGTALDVNYESFRLEAMQKALFDIQTKLARSHSQV